MARYTGPRVRVLRALGVNLPGLSAKTMEKRPAPPGQHGARRRKTLSNYGRRLKEKQKLRAHYGVSERQLRRIAADAARTRGNAMATLVELLERRLDSVVFRSGFARTIPAARQLVTHGHIDVNGKRLSYPAARVNRGDVITVHGTRGEAAVRKQQEVGGAVLAAPDWLEVDSSAPTARVTSLPGADAVPFPIELQLVVEFYS
jgi:small subunit ribosomal protein S4